LSRQFLAIATVAKTPVSDEEILLRKRARRRLVGAIALVLVAVVILPMVLDREPQQRPQDVNIQIPPIPPQAQGDAAAPALPPAAPSAGEPAPQQPAETPAAVPAEPRQGPEPAPQPTVAAAPKPPVVSAAPTPTPAAPAAESLVIQIGCFSDADKVRSFVGKIKANRIPAFSTPAPGPEAACTRVRAGPFSSQAAAQTARERLLKLKLIQPPSEGKIVRRGD
jgi:DedD protein